eukprot:3940527-Rhodomonas_salina.2
MVVGMRLNLSRVSLSLSLRSSPSLPPFASLLTPLLNVSCDPARQCYQLPNSSIASPVLINRTVLPTDGTDFSTSPPYQGPRYARIPGTLIYLPTPLAYGAINFVQATVEEDSVQLFLAGTADAEGRCYEMCGTELAYGHSTMLRDVRY